MYCLQNMSHFYQNKSGCVFISFRYWNKYSNSESEINCLFHLQAIHGGVFRGEAEKSPKKTEMISFSDKMSPQSHQPRLTKPVKEANMKGRDSSAARKSSAGDNMKNAGWTCGECLLWVPDRETFVNHMKTSHGRVRSFPSIDMKLSSVLHSACGFCIWLND